MYNDPIEKIEKLLRELIHNTLSSKYGENWTNLDEVGLGQGWHNKLVKYRDNEVKNTKSTKHYDWLIGYSEFRELGELLEKNRELFLPILGDYDKYYQFYKTANELRNTVKHHRNIRPHQHNLLEGIAGEFEDIINIIWRIGNILKVKKTRLQFIEQIKTTDKNDELILSEITDCINWWRNAILEFLNDHGESEEGHITEEFDDFNCSINSKYFEFSMKASNQPTPNTKIDDIEYKSIGVNMAFESSSNLKIDNLLLSIDKPYKQIEYELEEELDLERLIVYGRDGGINLHKAGSITLGNQNEITQIECQLINGKLRIGVSKYIPAVHQLSGGKIFATAGKGICLWQFHNLIQENQLIRFMIGDIAPRTIIHLLELSQIKPTS